MLVDSAYYEQGVRRQRKLTLEEAAACPRHGGSYVWIELDDPSPELMGEVSKHFGLHELAVEDAAQAHQRPKVESYDDFYFIVYRTAKYDAENREVIFGELDLFLGVGFVIPSATTRPATTSARAGISRPIRTSPVPAPRRPSGRSSTRWSTTTSRSSTASRTTSRTRSARSSPAGRT